MHLGELRRVAFSFLGCFCCRFSLSAFSPSAAASELEERAPIAGLRRQPKRTSKIQIFFKHIGNWRMMRKKKQKKLKKSSEKAQKSGCPVAEGNPGHRATVENNVSKACAVRRAQFSSEAASRVVVHGAHDMDALHRHAGLLPAARLLGGGVLPVCGSQRGYLSSVIPAISGSMMMRPQYSHTIIFLCMRISSCF